MLSPHTQALLAQAAQSARADGASEEEAVTAFDAVFASTPPPTDPFGPDGLTAPDADGLVRDKVLDEARAKYIAENRPRAAEKFGERYAYAFVAATLGSDEAPNPAYITVKQACHNVAWHNAVGLAVDVRVQPQIATRAHIGVQYAPDPGRGLIPGSVAVPGEIKVVDGKVTLVGASATLEGARKYLIDAAERTHEATADPYPHN